MNYRFETQFTKEMRIVRARANLPKHESGCCNLLCTGKYSFLYFLSILFRLQILLLSETIGTTHVRNGCLHNLTRCVDLKLYWQRSWGLIFSEMFQSLQWCCCCVLHSLPQNTVLPQNVVGASFKYHELCRLAWSLGKMRNYLKFWLKAAVVNFSLLLLFFSPSFQRFGWFRLTPT